MRGKIVIKMIKILRKMTKMVKIRRKGDKMVKMVNLNCSTISIAMVHYWTVI